MISLFPSSDSVTADKEASDICVSHLTRKYGRKTVLNDISLTANAGDCVGIVGINGGGKSTLLSILAGTLKAQGGTYTCFAHNMFREKKAFRTLVGYLPQDNPLMEDLTAADNLRLWYGKKVPADLPVLKQMQLTDLLDKRVGDFSGGMKRRLAIACAVSKNPPVLILDEPTSSLDLYQKKIIRDYIASYTSGGGIAFLSSHDPEEIRMCSTLYYLCDPGVLEPVDTEEALRRLSAGMR